MFCNEIINKILGQNAHTFHNFRLFKNSHGLFIPLKICDKIGSTMFESLFLDLKKSKIPSQLNKGLLHKLVSIILQLSNPIFKNK
jgi:hypothetical protein